MTRVLVAGIGNIFLSDDAWGVDVVRELERDPRPPGLSIVDFGIRGVHLAHELLDGYDALVLVDAVPMGERPGTVALFEPERSTDAFPSEPTIIDAHGMNPVTVLDLIDSLGAAVDRILVVGCEPATVEEGMGLSPEVAATVGQGAELCRQVIADLYANANEESNR